MKWSGAGPLGAYGEIYIAPVLLRRWGATGIVDLNREVRLNFPWGDFYCRRRDENYFVCVRTRVKRTNTGKDNDAYNEPGGCGYYLGEAELNRQRLAPATPIWIAISMEIDQTFDAYWGDADEMRHYGDPTDGWDIIMNRTKILEYTTAGRRLAFNEAHDFNWLLYPDNWTYGAHRLWRKQSGVQIVPACAREPAN
jgi:hypothetical protein